jgi:hypothetical protein
MPEQRGLLHMSDAFIPSTAGMIFLLSKRDKEIIEAIAVNARRKRRIVKGFKKLQPFCSAVKLFTFHDLRPSRPRSQGHAKKAQAKQSKKWRL